MMAIKDAFIAELKHESSMTRKMLERVPPDQNDWRPHEKSMSLGRLATHVAEITHWISDIIRIDDYDFMRDYNPNRENAKNSEELLKIFQESLDKAISDLSGMSDDDFSKNWTLRRGEKVILTSPKKVSLRRWGYSHLIHHRGQLSVYLRLLDIPVPGMYGPSADDKM